MASQVILKICYTLFMQSRPDWPNWAESLRRCKLDGLASWLLEAGAPLTVLGAQAIYISQPFRGISCGKRYTFAYLAWTRQSLHLAWGVGVGWLGDAAKACRTYLCK